MAVKGTSRHEAQTEREPPREIWFASKSPKAIPYPFVTRVSDGEALHVEPFQVDVENLRRRRSEDAPSLANEGFELVNVGTYENLGKGGDGQWEDRYLQDMCKWLKEYVGATEVKGQNFCVRRRQPELPFDHYDPDKAGTASIAHADNSWENALSNAYKHYPELLSDSSKGRRFAIFNAWRPLKGPVLDCPLVLCDARTADRSSFELTADSYGNGYFLMREDRQRFGYFRDQTAEEMTLFRAFDSTIPLDKGGMTPHASFVDQERAHLALRESIEVRLYAIW